MKRQTRRILPAGVVACAVTLAAIGTAVAASRMVMRSVNNPRYGRLVVGPARYTLYVYCTGFGTHCPGAPTRSFSRLIARGRVVAGAHSHLRARKLGTRRLKNGKRQVTYYGYPLYLYKGDRKPGQMRGEGKGNFKGAWYVISTGGRPLAKAGY